MLRIAIALVSTVAMSAAASANAEAAQIAAQTASLAGQITDAQGGALVGATVTAVAESTGTGPLVAVTDAAGRYQFDRLTPDTFEVGAVLSGFRAERRTGVALAPGESRTLDLELGLAPFGQNVEVVGVSPLLGGGVTRSQVPAAVASISGAELAERQTASLADALNERFGAVTLEGATTNLFQPTLRFRGFSASPVLGLPQGVAVYQNGVRINEPFGDTVQFDLIPQFAVDHVQLTPGAEPTFGLNALGGALALRLKNGFDSQGFRGEVSGGSFGRVSTTADWGGSRGPWALYVGATRFDEDGWRVASPSTVTQTVADLAYRQGRVDAGMSFTYADSDLNGNAPAPIELLEVERSAVFTFPDNTENRLAFTQGRVDVVVSSTWSLQGTAYYRDLDRQTSNGDEADFRLCDDDSLPLGAPANTLCFGVGDDDDDGDAPDTLETSLTVEATEGDDEMGPPTEQLPLVDTRDTGRFITTDDAEGNAAFNRTTTRAQGYGGTVQATSSSALHGHPHVLTLGVSADLADVDFASDSEVGTLTLDRTVAGSSLFAGVYGRAPDDQFNTALDTANRAVGVYFSDTLSLTDRIHTTVSGRVNVAQIEIVDRLGTSLNGDHHFSRFNLGVGAVYQLTDAMSVFGRYAESNRAPTAAELSCADPDEPCRVPNAFVSDPPLTQAVARSVEGGFRGGAQVTERGRVDWSIAAYRTGITDDILFVASPTLIGAGFFQNAGDTLRVGMDAELSGQLDRVGWYASYGLIQGTFESRLELPGNAEVNAATTDAGTVVVDPGDRLPGLPRHSFKAGARVEVLAGWDVMFENVRASSRVFVGDEGNDLAPVPGYTVANVRSTYRLTDRIEVFARIENLFDSEFSTFGVLAELEVFLSEVPNADDPRFLSPGNPRSGFAGLRIRF